MVDQIHAAIDLGSNTTRLLLALRTEKNGIKRLFAQQETTRLGQNLKPGGSLLPRAITRTFDVLQSYRETAYARGAISILAGATGAVRDASDGREFAARVKRDLGIETRLLSGREEANLTAAGVLTALSPIPGRGLIFDLGGRSLEFMETEKTEIRQCVSLDLGAVALTEAFFSSDPPFLNEIQALRSDVRRILNLGLKSFSRMSEDRPVIGTAGTMTTLAAMALKLIVYDPEVINNFPLKRDILEGLFQHMAGMSTVERAGLPGLPNKRADIILAGTLVVQEIMNFFNINQIITSDAGLLEGLWLAAAKKGGSHD